VKRMGAIYSLDQRSALRKSHENPEIQKLYEEFLERPGGALSHELLHTKYTDRSHETFPAYSVAERRADQAHHEVGVGSAKQMQNK
jgi:Iron hydrogenase small subunit